MCIFSLWVEQIMVQSPYIFCQATVYSIVVYAMPGFEWSIGKFLWYLFYLFFTTLAICYFTLYGMMVVTVTLNLHMATIIASAFYGMWNLFSGFIVPSTVGTINVAILLLHQFEESMLLILFCFWFGGNENNRGSYCGGDGTIGHVPGHGLCIAC